MQINCLTKCLRSFFSWILYSFYHIKFLWRAKAERPTNTSTTRYFQEFTSPASAPIPNNIIRAACIGRMSFHHTIPPNAPYLFLRSVSHTKKNITLIERPINPIYLRESLSTILAPYASPNLTGMQTPRNNLTLWESVNSIIYLSYNISGTQTVNTKETKHINKVIPVFGSCWSELFICLFLNQLSNKY